MLAAGPACKPEPRHGAPRQRWSRDRPAACHGTRGEPPSALRHGTREGTPPGATPGDPAPREGTLLSAARGVVGACATGRARGCRAAPRDEPRARARWAAPRHATSRGRVREGPPRHA
ncbi:hypothetical protein PAHAL_3G386700 [Panicum hallii]|uniref:Uncharacterized protein n=1 Tax=Panicum hallii TaxID=206008 RepID=A0A2T8KKU2_9POAL|nr:hypothetical protein PAHAL_3G386700 [Panicum hallii]